MTYVFTEEAKLGLTSLSFSVEAVEEFIRMAQWEDYYQEQGVFLIDENGLLDIMGWYLGRCLSHIEV